MLAVVAWLNRPRDEPVRATVDDAVESFRAAEEKDGGVPAGRDGRAPGVYRYATRGFESVQTPVIGTTHDYDGVSTIVISEGRCGEVERWQVLAGRWTEGESCPGPRGYEFVAAREFHEFFGVAQEDSFRCRGIAITAPSVVRRGARFSGTCESDDSSASSTSRVIGFETVTVGGEAFEAIHSESTSRLEGKSSGVTERQEWRRRTDGLLLRRSATSRVDTTSAAGGTHYTERYTIHLLDPKPRR